MPTVDVLHFCHGYQALGGVESMLKLHYREDLRFGLRSRFAVCFEDGPATDERIHYLAFNPRSTIRGARRKMLAAAGNALDVAVYHGAWGMAYLADLDHAQRRVLFLHGYVPGLEEAAISRQPWVDGILCVSEPLQATIRQCLPAMDPSRIGYIPYPIHPPDESPNRQEWGQRPLIIGFSGRVMKVQKRVDRFPELVRELDRLGVNYQLEFLGDGLDRSWLEKEFQGDPRIKFHGRRSGADYWGIISQWDVIAFTSAYEGTPISMIEAMNRGVIPLYPAINTGGDAYAHETAPRLLYSDGNLAEAAQALRWLADRDAQEVATLRDRARAQVLRHRPDSYHQVFAGFIRQILSAPRVGHSNFPSRPFPIDWLSFTAVEKLSGWRRRLKNLTRRTPPASPSAPTNVTA